jgi:Protein of unknown function (DUF3341)
MATNRIYGLLAEFESPDQLVNAAHIVREAGYRSIDAFSPMPIEGLAEAVGFTSTRLPLVVLLGGMFGAAAGFLLQWYANVLSFPLNVGGKPHNSWPAFIPITFELAILCAALAATFGMLAMNGLPTPYHPLFNVPRFALATRGRFFLCIKARDKRFDIAATRRFLETLKPFGVYEAEV